MITVAPTEDMALVRSVFAHPDVWPFVHDDAAPALEDWEPLEHPSITYLAVREGDALAGCAMVYPVNGAMYELHSAMLPEFRGQGSQDAARALFAWLWANTDANFLMTWVPAYNIPAAVAANKAGFTKQARLPAAYRKGGKLHDLILYGVGKCPQ